MKSDELFLDTYYHIKSTFFQTLIQNIINEI